MGESIFNELYALREGEVIRRVAPPFIGERLDFYRSNVSPYQVASSPNGPQGMIIPCTAGKPRHPGMKFGGGGYTVENLITDFIGIYPQDIEGDSRLANTTIPGDFAFKPDASVEEYRTSLQSIITDALQSPVSLTIHDVQVLTIVFTGTWREKPLIESEKVRELRRIEIYGRELCDPKFGGGGQGDINKLANWVGRWINRPTMFEAREAPDIIRWHLNDPVDGGEESRKQAHDLALVCTHIEEQTGLKWAEEMRVRKHMFVERK